MHIQDFVVEVRNLICSERAKKGIQIKEEKKKKKKSSYIYMKITYEARLQKGQGIQKGMHVYSILNSHE